MKNAQTGSLPEGYHTLTPALTIKGCAKALDFYQRALDAKIIHSMEMPNGVVMHAEMRVGDSRFMLSDEFPDWGVLSPETLGGTPVAMFLYVADVDVAFAQAIREGGKELQPPSDQFWGDRMGQFLDPFGHKWSLATRVEELPWEEMERRGKEMMSKAGQP